MHHSWAPFFQLLLFIRVPEARYAIDYSHDCVGVHNLDFNLQDSGSNSHSTTKPRWTNHPLNPTVVLWEEEELCTSPWAPCSEGSIKVWKIKHTYFIASNTNMNLQFAMTICIEKKSIGKQLALSLYIHLHPTSFFHIFTAFGMMRTTQVCLSDIFKPLGFQYKPYIDDTQLDFSTTGFLPVQAGDINGP